MDLDHHEHLNIPNPKGAPAEISTLYTKYNYSLASRSLRRSCCSTSRRNLSFCGVSSSLISNLQSLAPFLSAKKAECMVAKFSLNSSKLYYFSNPVEISDSTEYDSWIGSNYLAELMQFNISENDSTQIAENSDGFCGDGGIWHCKYKTTSDEKHICDLVFWNGKESKVIAIDIIK